MKSILKPGIHWLFLFIPITFLLELKGFSAPWVFFSAALSIVPIARLIGTSTEHLASYTGDSIGGMLNATFGNFPELIIAIMALRAGLYDMVLASLAGAILANLLLALGVSFLVGGLRFRNQEYNPVSSRIYSTMMLIAVFSLIVPSAYHQFFGSGGYTEQENTLNIILAVTLLVLYGCYLVFMLKTHKDFFKSIETGGHGESENHWSIAKAITMLVVASVMAAFMSEVLVGAAEETGKELGMSSVFVGLIFLAVVGGAAESISAVTMAAKNKMDLSISIALGSSIQIALFIAPLLVLMSLFVGPGQMNLTFGRGLLGTLFITVLIGALVVSDGRSNWYKGVQLIVVYFLLGMMCYFIPEGG